MPSFFPPAFVHNADLCDLIQSLCEECTSVQDIVRRLRLARPSTYLNTRDIVDEIRNHLGLDTDVSPAPAATTLSPSPTEFSSLSPASRPGSPSSVLSFSSMDDFLLEDEEDEEEGPGYDGDDEGSLSEEDYTSSLNGGEEDRCESLYLYDDDEDDSSDAMDVGDEDSAVYLFLHPHEDEDEDGRSPGANESSE